MARLYELHASVTVDFVHTSRGQDFNGLDLDCAIRYGNGDWMDADSDYLAGRELLLIAPPKPHRSATLSRPSDIAKHTLLHHFQVPDAWPQWCRAQGLTKLSALQGPVLDNYNSIIRAVMAGLGLALRWRRTRWHPATFCAARVGASIHRRWRCFGSGCWMRRVH